MGRRGRLAALGVGGAAAYALGYRPWQLRWGADDAEVHTGLPGDELVERPQWTATRAVTVAATPDQVWPWLVQMGAGRAGWYSYDRFDNGGVPSAVRVVPELQRLAVGDRLPLTAGSDAAWRVESLEPARHLVLAHRANGGVVATALVLHPLPGGACRLVHRVQFRVPARVGPLAWAAAMDAGDFVMARRMLLGVRDRAEGLARQVPGALDPEDADPGTPLRYDLSVRVRSVAPAVFAVLSDVQDHVDEGGMPGRVRMDKTPPGPTVVGTRWREWVRLLPDAVPRRLPGGWLRVDSEVVEIDPPRLLRERFRSRWFDGTLLYTVTADEEGSVLRQQEELRPRGPLHRLAGAVDRSLRPRLLARLAAIRDVVERAG